MIYNESINNGESTVEFSGIEETNVKTNAKISKDKYSNFTDNEDPNKIIRSTSKVINAIDIDWNQAQIKDTNGEPIIGPINTTGELINEICKAKYSGGVSDGIPIYDDETINAKRELNTLPNKYIAAETYSTSNSQTLIQRLIDSVTALQTEVNNLKGKLKQGIYSYNNDATYISTTANDIYGDAEEPLWAIDESNLDPAEVYDENDQVDLSNLFDNLKNNTDCRLYAFADVNNNSSNIILKTIDGTVSLSINLSDLLGELISESKLASIKRILIILSRKISDKQYPVNFCYITCYDNENTSVIHGYISEELKLVNSETDINNTYCFDSFEGLSNIRIYSEDMEVGDTTIEEVPGEDDITCRVAHIAIRTVKNTEILNKVTKSLVSGELVMDESTEKLYIKINNKLINIGAKSDGGNVNPDEPGHNDDIMTNQEIIRALESQGIITISFVNDQLTGDDKYNPSNIITYNINKIGSIQFINEDTGKTFEFKTNAYGELKGTLLNEEATIGSRLGSTQLKDDWVSPRGVIGQLGEVEYTKDGKGTLGVTKDHGLYADRIKIGAVYAPLDTDIVHGCSHAYIELENTSDKDFNLLGCYLTYIRPNGVEYEKMILPLTGTIPAGGTYLIRGKQYVENEDDPNCFIHVDTYDQEWYVNKELIDLTLTAKVQKKDSATNETVNASYIFVLSYGFISNYESLGDTGTNSGEFLVAIKYDNSKSLSEDKTSNSAYVYPKGLIDFFGINAVRYGIPGVFTIKSNCIYKNTFELDPAKQAFNGLTTRDSSRQRLAKIGTDGMNLILDKEYIEFPKSDEKYPVNYFTPKASFEHKNVCTDKTKLNKEKPNAVTVSYGENIYTTRCFNWISATNGDEYVWLYNSNNQFIGKFESYKVRNLTHVDVHYTAEEIAAHNATLDIWDENTIKNAVYSFESFDSQEKTNKFGEGTVEVINLRNDGATVKVITNSTDQSFVGLSFNVNSLDESAVLQLFTTENTPISIWVTVSKVSDAGNYTTEEIKTHNDALDIWDSKTINQSASYNYDKEYAEYTNPAAPSWPRRKEYPIRVNNIIYCDYRENTVLDTDNKIKNPIGTGTIPKDVTYPEFSKASRACGLFAATNDFYVSHKCVIDVINPETNLQSETKYYYIVGKADKTGENPDLSRCSEKREFTMYPKSYEPRIYQISDQQGFHWIEYQVWAAAAIEVNKKIEADMAATASEGHPIIPIILNTGDLTQSGSRVNEWLDYFNAGDVLFNHFAQNNLVGNNDLNGTDIQFLGTGDDPGKSNGYYFYLFNCYDANNFFTTTENDVTVDHYAIANKTCIPSLYYIQTDDIRIVMVNSEITYVNCKNWFNLKYNLNNTEQVVNIYTGFTCSNNTAAIEKYVANEITDFTPIYTLLWHAFNKSENGNRKCIAACHEMPFTVITNESLQESQGSGDATKYPIQKYRSISNADKLVGSHLNQLNQNDFGAGIYWFSRLLESSGVKLCIGGHKHTYALSYPLRELYKYRYETIENGETVYKYKNSSVNGPMDMPETLAFEEYNNVADRPVIWMWDDKPDANNTDTNKGIYQWRTNSTPSFQDKSFDINFSKLPITYRSIINNAPGDRKFYPVTVKAEDDEWKDKAVIYMMCQATGYKLTSNKELPSANQKFSQIIPETTVVDGADTPSNNQKHPMFIIYELNKTEETIKAHIKLARIENIFNPKYKFTQSDYGTSEIVLKYIKDKPQGNNYDNFGSWSNIEDYMISEFTL